MYFSYCGKNLLLIFTSGENILSRWSLKQKKGYMKLLGRLFITNRYFDVCFKILPLDYIQSLNVEWKDNHIKHTVIESRKRGFSLDPKMF